MVHFAGTLIGSGLTPAHGVLLRARGAEALAVADLTPDTWRHKSERAELVERLIAQTSRADQATATLRDLAGLEGDRPLAAYVLLLQARLGVAEANVARLVAEREQQAA